MKTKHMILIAVALLASAQLACSGTRYSAEIGAIETPVPTAAPQIIVVQQPAPEPAPASDNSEVLIVLLVVIVVCTMGSGIVIGYLMRRPAQQPPARAMPESLTITTHNYYPSTPAQLTPFEQYQLLRRRGIARHEANQIVSEGRAHQYLSSGQ